jgi:hypothetical protein
MQRFVTVFTAAVLSAGALSAAAAPPSVPPLDKGEPPPFEGGPSPAKDLKAFCAPKKFETSPGKPKPPHEFHLCRMNWFLHYKFEDSQSSETWEDKPLSDLEMELKIKLEPVAVWQDKLFAYTYTWNKPKRREWQNYVFCNDSESNHHRVPHDGGWWVRFNWVHVTPTGWVYLIGGTGWDQSMGTTGRIDIGEWVQYTLIAKNELKAARAAKVCLQKAPGEGVSEAASTQQ